MVDGCCQISTASLPLGFQRHRQIARHIDSLRKDRGRIGRVQPKERRGRPLQRTAAGQLTNGGDVDIRAGTEPAPQRRIHRPGSGIRHQAAVCRNAIQVRGIGAGYKLGQCRVSGRNGRHRYPGAGKLAEHGVDFVARSCKSHDVANKIVGCRPCRSGQDRAVALKQHVGVTHARRDRGPVRT